MPRLLLAILLVFSTIAVVAHGILVYKLSATYSLIAEEETSDESPVVKEGKDISQEKTTISLDLYRHSQASTLQSAELSRAALFSQGFYDKPYNPPEVI